MDCNGSSAFSTSGINRDLIKCFDVFFFMLFDDFMHTEESTVLALFGTKCELERSRTNMLK